MEVQQFLYIGLFAVGAISMLASFLGAEFSADVGGGLLSVLSISAAFVGFGATALVCDFAGMGLVSLVPAAAIALLFGLLGAIGKKYLDKQSGNSHQSGTDHYRERVGRVRLDVEPGRVTEIDVPGIGICRVINAWSDTLHKGDEVVIQSDGGNQLSIYPFK